MTAERSFRIILMTASAALVSVSVFMARPGSTYRFSFLFLLPLLWGVFGLRRQLALSPLHLALFASFLLFHDLGALGLYREKIFGLQFDVYVHFYFGIVGGLIVSRALQLRCGWSGWWLVVATALLMLGIGAVHELIECGTTIWLGKEKGMLKLDPNDPYDTQKDLLNNLLGALLACLLRGLFRRRSNAGQD